MDQPDEPHPTVHRRTVLVGAATAAVAAAGVAGGVKPAGAAPAAAGHAALPLAAATTLAPAQTGAIEADQVHVVPAGEIVDDNVQAALYALDSRLSKTHLIDDLQVATTLIDDFLVSLPVTQTVGALGWGTRANSASPPRTVESTAVTTFPGIIKLSTGGVNSGYMALNLGSFNLRACPVFVAETRCRIDTLNTTGDRAAVYFPLTSDIDANEPAHGCYFQYGSSDGTLDNGKWYAVCANNGNRTRVVASDIVGGVPINADGAFHRFRVTSDGGEQFSGGVVRFYIDDVLVAEITTNLPSSHDPMAWYSPTIGIRKHDGPANRTLVVDYYALRWESAR